MSVCTPSTSVTERQDHSPAGWRSQYPEGYSDCGSHWRQHRGSSWPQVRCHHYIRYTPVCVCVWCLQVSGNLKCLICAFFYVLLCFSQVHRLHPLLWLHPRTKTPAPSTTGIPQFTTMSCRYAAGIPADFCTKTDWDQVIITPMHAISHGQADLVIQVTVEM